MQGSRVNVSGAQRAIRGGSIQQQCMVGSTQQLVIPHRKLVPGQEVSTAHGAPETLHVIHTLPGSHHQVTAAEARLAFCTFYPK